MSRAGRIIALAVHIGFALAAFTGSWWVWLETGLPCTAETALTLLCNPQSPLSQWVRLDVIGQCGIIAGVSLAITGGNDGMFFLLERQARKQEAQARKQETARADKAETGWQEDQTAMREWVQNLPEEQKDAIYTGPVTIGGIVWMRVDGKDHFGRRADNGGWLMDSLPDLSDR